MTFTLRIYRRRRPNETAGQLSKFVELEAGAPEAAEKEAREHLEKVNWETHFAAVMDKNGFVKFWTSKHA